MASFSGQRVLGLAQKLISIDSRNPPGSEAAIARFVGEYCRKQGARVRYFSEQKGRTSVIAEIAGGSGKRLLLTPHLDTVPAGRNWRRPPLSPKVERGRLYGLGATDCKGNLACAMEALARLKDCRIRLPYTLVLAATADEECGSRFGLLPLFKKGLMRCDAAVVLDADAFDIVVAQKGLLHLKVTVRGKSAHGAYPWRGTNAIEQAVRALSQLELRRPKVRNRYLRPPTLNIGTIRGGDKVNMVADWCEIELDYRFLPGTDEGAFMSDLKKALRRCRKGYTIEVEGLQQPYSIREDDPLVASLSAAMKRCGAPVRLRGSEGATVITFFQERGIPAVATGFGIPGCEHCADEYITVRNLERGASVIEEFLREFRFNS